MISAWSNVEEVYTNGDNTEKFILIYGYFHGNKYLGLYWTNYCQNAPMVVDKSIQNVILSGLLQKALDNGNHPKEINALLKAIEFFKSTREEN